MPPSSLSGTVTGKPASSDPAHEGRFSNPAFYRYFPFAVFMGFIGVEELFRGLASYGFPALSAPALYYLYPLKAVTVGYLLYRFRGEYHELSIKDLARVPTTLAAIAIGLVVFFLWIRMDWTFGPVAAGFNPTLFGEKEIRVAMTLFRVCGAVLVVPVMEELFWRSFLIRYISDSDFQRVPIGTFTTGSFIFTVVLFGLEHSYIVAGIMAGIFYNVMLYKTRSLAHCVMAHAVTNLALAVYVITTGEWRFW